MGKVVERVQRVEDGAEFRTRRGNSRAEGYAESGIAGGAARAVGVAGGSVSTGITVAVDGYARFLRVEESEVDDEHTNGQAASVQTHAQNAAKRRQIGGFRDSFAPAFHGIYRWEDDTWACLARGGV
jgi:hypothetical protein